MGETRGVADFPRGHSSHAMFVEHARILEQLARETGRNVAEERARLRASRTPADQRTLRGLPAVGRGIVSVIAGAQPEAALIAKEQDVRQ
jgi:hypothetical protein